PGVGPEAEIDAPPVVGDAACQQLRHELIEVEDAGAEGYMPGAAVLGESAIGVGNLQMRDLTLEHLQEFQGAAGQRVPGTKVGGASIEQDAEVRVAKAAHRIDKIDNVLG